MRGHLFQKHRLLAIKTSWLEPPTEPRNEAFSPVSCLLRKNKTTSLAELIQVEGLSLKREKIKASGWLWA